MMKNLKLSIPLLVFALVLTGCVGGNGGPKAELEVEAEETIAPVAVVTKELIEEKQWKQLYVVGQLEASEEYNVLPYTAGIVEEVLVEVGDFVKAGDVLYTLDTDDLALTQSSSMTQAQTSRDQAYNGLQIARNSLDQAQTSLADAQKNYDDNLVLYQGGSVTESTMNSLETALSNAHIAYETAVLNLRTSQDSYDQAVVTYSNYVDDFDARFDKMVVESPISGIVTKVDVQVDVSNNLNMGVTVSDISSVVVDARVIEKNINHMEVGQSALVAVDAVDESYEGVVTSVTYTSTSGYYPIEIVLDNQEGLLKAGMYAGVTVNVAQTEAIVSIPKTAIVSIGSTRYVFIEEEGLAVRRIIETGEDFGGLVEVSSGLAGSEKLVVQGQAYLQEGTPLIINR